MEEGVPPHYRFTAGPLCVCVCVCAPIIMGRRFLRISTVRTLRLYTASVGTQPVICIFSIEMDGWINSFSLIDRSLFASPPLLLGWKEGRVQVKHSAILHAAARIYSYRKKKKEKKLLFRSPVFGCRRRRGSIGRKSLISHGLFLGRVPCYIYFYMQLFTGHPIYRAMK